ncbi:MAG: glycosyltransferase [Sulfuricella sp.]|jgi:GT2 family glycosyltransferase|nr:glycosyltransferase [Sulfuricella sp.]
MTSLNNSGQLHIADDSGALVDVVVPVYRGYDETLRCIESVLENSQETRYELIVVDDASPEPGLAACLDDLAARRALTLLRNSSNLGFVQSVNLGMSLHPERDVVLLNSDTLVANDWLDRIRRCAYSAARVGTVTPFSNNATICSYPEFCAENVLPEGVESSALDQMFRRVNHGKSVVIPTAIGFCVYIRRACLDQVGLFDAGNFGKGYGEENDFSMRASQQGWLNLLCADTFVYHAGGVSFMAEKDARVATALDVLYRLHPGYEDLIRRFVAADPLKELRAAVDRELAAYRARKMPTWGKLCSFISKFMKNFQ